ncbi:unnamed protein product [Mytilus coruscus]|uniref:Uncharacterized protein n=1 Tax=Mytilus coruscus TaxID=42192 RepID=A0A6J8F3K2_MYTCO|nr:unnamed protein product [Mytilus coruscus]
MNVPEEGATNKFTVVGTIWSAQLFRDKLVNSLVETASKVTIMQDKVFDSLQEKPYVIRETLMHGAGRDMQMTCKITYPTLDKDTCQSTTRLLSLSWKERKQQLHPCPSSARIVVDSLTYCYVAVLALEEGSGFSEEEIKTQEENYIDLKFILAWVKDSRDPLNNGLFLASPAAKSHWIIMVMSDSAESFKSCSEDSSDEETRPLRPNGNSQPGVDIQHFDVRVVVRKEPDRVEQQK